MTQTSGHELSADCIYPECGGRMVLVDIATLYALLPDWIARNAERVDSLRRWAERATEIGRDEVARQIAVAAAHIVACNQALNAAVESLEEMK